jgi:hypothetical protein
MDLVFRIWKKRLLADFVLRLSQHCARQQIWHSESGNAVRVNELTVQSLETLRFLTNIAFRGLETLCLSTNLVFSVETLSLSAGLAFRIWKRCACQRISC